MTNRGKSAAYIAVFLALGSGAALAAQSWLAGWTQNESGGNTTETNGSSTAIGATQMTQGAWEQSGLLTLNSPVTRANFGTGAWNNVTFKPNQFGITSKEDLLANPDAQNYYTQIYAQQTWNSSQLQSVAGKVGGEIPGVPGSTITNAALLTCGMELGAGGCATFLKNGTTGDPALDANARFRMQSEAGNDASAVTNAADTTNATGPSVNSTSTVGNGAVTGLYCNPQIATMMQQNGAQAVKNWTMLATAPGTGYTTLGGGSIMQAAGLAPGATKNGPLASALGVNDNDFYMVACVDRLMNSGLNIFGSFSLDDILAKLEQAACQAIYGMFTQITQPLSQSLGQYSGLGVPGVPGFFPGLNLGSIGGGLNTSITPGSATGSGPTVKFGSSGGSSGTYGGLDTGWYGNGGSSGGGSYGRLMGR